MGKIPIIQKDHASQEPDNNTLPTWYMNDYSVIAIVVDELETATRILQKKGVPVIDDDGRQAVGFDNTAGLSQIIALLTDHTIECSLSDSVSQVYQG